jgi:hypothetical protein
MNYLEAGAGDAGVAGVVGVAVLFTAFLFFFTCFFATGAVESVEAGAAVCAASERPAVASVSVRASTAEVIFFTDLSVPFFEALVFASVTMDEPTIKGL